MKRQNYFKFLLLLLLTCCMIALCACSAEGDGTVDYPPENIGDGTDTNPEKGDEYEFTTVNANAKIIRNVRMYGETKNFTNATQTVKEKLYAAGGYVEASEISGGESLYNSKKTPKNANYTLRIPTQQVDSFVESLRTLLNVTSYSENTKDVTLEYYDLQSRIDTLELKKAALEKLLENANTVNEIKTYQDELFDVISEIESLKSKLKVYDNKVNYSTISLTVVEVVEYTEAEPDEEKSFGDKISDTFKSSWSGMGTFFEYFVIVIVAIFPTLLLLAMIAAITLTIIWLVRRKKRKNKSE